MTDVLKPCPFCGEEQPPHDGTSWVRCLGCGAETGWRPTGAEAAAAWNTRADRIEKLEAELHLMKTAGIVEVSVRNTRVMEYMTHWEGRAETAEAKLAKAVELVERSFNEGFGEGMDDVLRQRGGKTWYDSHSRKRLAELKGDT